MHGSNSTAGRTAWATYVAMSVGALAFAGCGEGFGIRTGQVEREFSLVAVAGKAPPAAFPRGTAQLVLRADTIRFHVGGTWSRVTVSEFLAADGSTTPLNDRSTGFLSRVGGDLLLDFKCDDVVVLSSCVRPDRVVRTNDGLLIRESYIADFLEVRYAEIDDR